MPKDDVSNEYLRYTRADDLRTQPADDPSHAAHGFRPGAGPNILPRRKKPESIEELALEAFEPVSLSDLIQHACDMVQRQLQVEYVALLELIAEDRLIVRAGVGWRTGIVGEATVGTSLSSQAGYTLLHHRPVIVADIRHEQRFNVDKRLHEHAVRSSLTVNVPAAGGKPLGTFGAYTTSRRKFTNTDTEFLTRIARILGGALQRAAQDERARHLEQRLSALEQASYLLAASHDYDDALASAARIALEHLADWCFIDIANPDRQHNGSRDIHRLVQAKDTLHAHNNSGHPRQDLYDYTSENTLRYGTPSILRTGQPERISPVEDALLEDIARDRHLELLHDLRPSAYMCVPLHARRRLIGSMGFIRTRSEGYRQEELDLASTLARYTALTLESGLQITTTASGHEQLVRPIKHHKPLVSDTPHPLSNRAIPITRRQMEVLKEKSKDKTDKEVAVTLGISQHTVRKHVQAVFEVFEVDSQSKAIAYARKLGLITDDPFDSS